MNFKKIIALGCIVSSICLFGNNYQFPEVKVDQSNPYVDHLSIFRYFFSQTKVDSFLEFGLGEGTEFFLENCEKLTSVELLTPSHDDQWFTKCQKKYERATNWNPILHFGSEKMRFADEYAKMEKKDPSLIDGTYLLEIKDLCDSLLESRSYDVAFVDPGVHFRGDIVQELFGRVPIIVAHDTAYGKEVYGWNRISTPFDYVKIEWKKGCGTTFWIHKSKEDLIRKLVKTYIPVEKKKFRIFFPDMHPDVTKSLALLCRHLGHTLLIPGKSFKEDQLFKIKYNGFSGEIAKDPQERPWYFQKNVEVVETDNIWKNPPDILFVNCDLVEDDVLNIYQRLLKMKKDVKLAYYSGNDRVPYKKKFVRNLISTDATTINHLNSEDLHYAYWVPWLDWDSLSFTGVNHQGPLNAYLGNHYIYDYFRPAQEIFSDYSDRFNGLFDMQFKLIDKVPWAEMFSLLDQSIGTIHIKNEEGTGYTILQSLAKGRPLFLKRSFSLNKRLMNWCIDGVNAIFFDDEEEFLYKLKEFATNSELRAQMQIDAAKQIRRMINNEREALIFENFLHHLR